MEIHANRLHAAQIVYVKQSTNTVCVLVKKDSLEHRQCADLNVLLAPSALKTKHASFKNVQTLALELVGLMQDVKLSIIIPYAAVHLDIQAILS